MEVLQRRDPTTLLPIIQAHTAPGAIIYSDEWAAYRPVSTLPGIAGHNTVNHSLNFVDTVSGTHTQSVESYWSRAKQKIQRMKGRHAEQLPRYLDESTGRSTRSYSSHSLLQPYDRCCTTVSSVMSTLHIIYTVYHNRLFILSHHLSAYHSRLLHFVISDPPFLEFCSLHPLIPTFTEHEMYSS